MRLDSQRAVVRVAPNWVGMVQSRLPLLEQAAAKVLGQPRQVVLETGQPAPPKEEFTSDATSPAQLAAAPTPVPPQPQPAASAPPPAKPAPAVTPESQPKPAMEIAKPAEPTATVQTQLAPANPRSAATPPSGHGDQLEKQARRLAEFFDGAVVSNPEESGDTAA